MLLRAKCPKSDADHGQNLLPITWETEGMASAEESGDQAAVTPASASLFGRKPTLSTMCLKDLRELIYNTVAKKHLPKKLYLQNFTPKCAKLRNDFIDARISLPIRIGIARCMRQNFLEACKAVQG